jgi:hypothetical protein
VLSDTGFDLHAYFLAARQTGYDYYLFMNSFSVILARDWLLKFWMHGSRKDVGLTGATGSFQSHYTSYCIGPVIREKIPILGVEVPVPRFIRWLHRRAIQNWWRRCLLKWYPPFPNAHIRTNAFMISRENLLAACPGPLLTKASTHRFESGRESLTVKVLRKGLRVLVVGKDGVGYDVDEWPLSGTFCQGRQENLLVSDNQTRRYDKCDSSDRDSMAKAAWGEVEGDEVR